MSGEANGPGLIRRRPLALGLRAQIVIALGIVFALSFALLALAAVGLTQRASDRHAARSAAIAGRAISLYLQRVGSPSHREIDAVIDEVLGEFPGSAVLIEWPDRPVYRRGVVPSRRGAFFPLRSGGGVTVWLSYSPQTLSSPLSGLLLFYVSLTGAAVMVLTYVALTFWLVRPVESLIGWTERLASGGQQTGVPLRGSAEVMRLALAFSEMAAQLRAERLALEQRLRDLEKTTVELRATQQQLVHGEKLATVGRLAAGVAHEIGNPLSAILGLVELLRGESLGPAEQKELLDRIQAETRRIHGIIRDLLDFSRRGVESDELEMTSDLRRVIDDAVNLVQPLKELRAVTLQVDCPQKLPRVIGPQQRLTQVLLNLLLNAADSLQGQGQGQGRIRVEAAPGEQNGYLTLSVSDDGPGIDEKILDALFEPFTTTKPPGKGTGLGLAISHTLIESLGGTLTASNPQGGGARFEMRLRIA